MKARRAKTEPDLWTKLSFFLSVVFFAFCFVGFVAVHLCVLCCFSPVYPSGGHTALCVRVLAPVVIIKLCISESAQRKCEAV